VKTLSKPNKLARRGTTIVEAAIVLPFVMFVIFGALKYGLLLFRWQQITNITRHAARLAILPGNNSADVYSMISTRMAAAKIQGYNNGWVAYNDAAGVGQPVTITITVPATNVDVLKFGQFGLGLILPSPQYLKASLTMSKEGP
jgi:Flp pilus assembly protein TadG